MSPISGKLQQLGTAVGVALVITASLSLASAETQPDARALAERFDSVVDIFHEHFYDKQVGAQRLPRDKVSEYRELALRSTSLAQFADVVNQMLGELETSHCTYCLNSTREFYELCAIFGQHGMRIDDDKLRMPWIGIVTRQIEGQWFVTAVLGEPENAAKPKILVGDRVLQVNGEPFDPIGSLAPHIDQVVTVTLERQPGETVTAQRKVQLVHPVVPYVQDMISSARVIDHEGLKIGYCRFWWMGRPETYGAAFHTVLQLKDCDAMIVDLRDGWGGQPFDYFALFDRNAALTLFTGPVAVLINDGTRSAKEVVAYDFKKAKRGILVGQETHGAVMPSRGFAVGKDGLLVLAVGKMPQKEYAAIEGDGVDPDIPVEHDVRYSQGVDPQLQAALDAITKRVPQAVQRKSSPQHELRVIDLRMENVTNRETAISGMIQPVWMPQDETSLPQRTPRDLSRATTKVFRIAIAGAPGDRR